MKKLIVIMLLVQFASGCAGVAISGSTYAVKASRRADLATPAEGGDTQAQYELGKSWCCMGPGFDTQTATKWFCAAAEAGHVEAQYELGRIYSGEVSRTPAPGQKLLQLAKARQSDVHAGYWFARAARAGHADASARLTRSGASVDDILARKPADCEYDDVFGR